MEQQAVKELKKMYKGRVRAVSDREIVVKFRRVKFDGVIYGPIDMHIVKDGNLHDVFFSARKTRGKCCHPHIATRSVCFGNDIVSDNFFNLINELEYAEAVYLLDELWNSEPTEHGYCLPHHWGLSKRESEKILYED